MRRTIDSGNPVQLGTFDCCHETVVITVPNPGQICFISHYRATLLLQSGGTQEGIPLTSTNGDGGGPIHRIAWKGELWALGSGAATVPIDVEGV